MLRPWPPPQVQGKASSPAWTLHGSASPDDRAPKATSRGMIRLKGGGGQGKHTGAAETHGNDAQHRHKEIRDELATLLLREGAGEDGKNAWAIDHIAMYLHSTLNVVINVDYNKEWLAGEVKWHVEHVALQQEERLREERPQTPTRSVEEEPWWVGDIVEINNAVGTRRSWMAGKRAILIRPAGGPGAWTVEVEGAKGIAEVDVAKEALEMAQRRAFTVGDIVKISQAADPSYNARLIQLTPSEGAAGEEEWRVRRLQGGHEEETSTVDRMRRWEMRKQADHHGPQPDQGNEHEQLVRAAQNAYKSGGDWRPGTMIEHMRAQLPELSQRQKFDYFQRIGSKAEAAIAEAKQRWRKGPTTLRLVTLNHGGIVTRMRAAIAATAGLRADARQPAALDTAALIWQADGRLHRTMRTLAADNDVVLLQETHLQEMHESGDSNELREQFRALVTTGEFAKWRLLESPATADDKYAGTAVWYNSETAQMEEYNDVIPGRMQTMFCTATTDATGFDLANVYVVPRSGSAKALAMLERNRKELQAAVDRAEEKGREIAIGGDLQLELLNVKT